MNVRSSAISQEGFLTSFALFKYLLCKVEKQLGVGRCCVAGGDKDSIACHVGEVAGAAWCRRHGL